MKGFSLRCSWRGCGAAAAALSRSLHHQQTRRHLGSAALRLARRGPGLLLLLRLPLPLPPPTRRGDRVFFFSQSASRQRQQRRPEEEDDATTTTPTSTRPPRRLHEDIYTLPNLLTVSRLAVAPVIGYCVLHDHHAWALGLFAYAGLSDLLDGWIARRWRLATVVGSVIDPMADKVLMTVLAVSLALRGALPVWLAVIILGRDVALGIAAVYYRWISLPPPKTLARYWDFSLPSAEVRPTTISKYNTFLQLALMGATMTAPLLAPSLHLGLPLAILQYTVAVTTVWSGASYVYSKDAVRILPRKRS